jgi:hypothetical protein
MMIAYAHSIKYRSNLVCFAATFYMIDSYSFYCFLLYNIYTYNSQFKNIIEMNIDTNYI